MHPEMIARYGYPAAPELRGPDPAAVAAAHAAVAPQVEEWFACAAEVIGRGPPFNASISHFHAIDQGHVVRNGLVLGMHEVGRDRTGRKSKMAPDLDNSLMPAGSVRRGVACPIHGPPCIAVKIGRYKWRPFNVVFAVEGWKIGTFKTPHHNGREPTESTGLAMLRPPGEIRISEKGAALPLSDRDSVTSFLLPYSGDSALVSSAIGRAIDLLHDLL